MWKDYFPAVDAIVFLIDCVDRARFPESKVELDSLLTDEQLSNCPVVILGNKVNALTGKKIHIFPIKISAIGKFGNYDNLILSFIDRYSWSCFGR